MPNVSLQTEISVLLRKRDSKALAEFLTRNQNQAQEVVTYFLASHEKQPTSKILNFLDLGLLPNRKSPHFSAYDAAMKACKITRKLPETQKNAEGEDCFPSCPDQKFCESIEYRILKNLFFSYTPEISRSSNSNSSSDGASNKSGGSTPPGNKTNVRETDVSAEEFFAGLHARLSKPAHNLTVSKSKPTPVKA